MTVAEALAALLKEIGQTGWINCTPKPSERKHRIDLMNAARETLEAAREKAE